MVWEIIIIIAAASIFITLARAFPRVRESVVLPDAALSSVKATSNVAKSANLDDLIFRADSLFKKHKLTDAEKLYVQAAALDPNNPRVYNRLGIIFLEQRNFKDAREAFETAIKCGGDSASRHANLGLSFIGLKNFNQARKCFEKAMELDPANEKYQELLNKVK